MEKVFIGNVDGKDVYMERKTWHGMDWLEADRLRQIMELDFPTQAELQAAVDNFPDIISLVKEQESDEVWLRSKSKLHSPDNELKPIATVCGSFFGLCRPQEKLNVLLVERKEMKKTKSKDFLNLALETQDNRAVEYDVNGEEERNMKQVVGMFNACTNHTLTEAQGYLFMECLKNVRLFNSPEFHKDSAVDGVSYSSLKAEAKANEHQQL